MLQELATELALRAGENTWVDGSLRDHDWSALAQSFQKEDGSLGCKSGAMIIFSSKN